MRVRANEKVVAIVSAIGIGAGGIVGSTAFAPKADAYPKYLEPQTQQPYPGMLSGPAAGANEWIQKMRQWELEQSIIDMEDEIAKLGQPSMEIVRLSKYKNSSGFSRLSDPGERRARILEARHRGSISADVHSELRRGLKAETIVHIEGAEVESAALKDGRTRLDLGDRSLEVDRVLLATGFPSHRPGGEWLDQAIAAHDLPCSECGYPLVDRGLRWHPRVLVTGSLAELEIGPVSRNLSGAQRAGERIAAVARKG